MGVRDGWPANCRPGEAGGPCYQRGRGHDRCYIFHMCHTIYAPFMRVALVCFTLVLAPFFGWAQEMRSVTLAWDANPEPDIAGYRLHYGEASGSYTTTADAGNVVTATVGDLVIGKTYFFVVTAYNTASLESLPSNEASFIAEPPSPHKFRGSYSGSVINGADGVNAYLKLLLSQRGRFTGQILLGTSVYRVRGRFDENGRATLQIASSEGPITLTLELDSLSGSILVEVSDGTGVTTVALAARAYSRANPAAEQGKYTLLLGELTPAAGSIAPASSGFASLVITKTGGVRAAGRLADGEAFTVNALLQSEGGFSVYTLLYGKVKGLLAGTVAIRDTAGVSDGDGTLSWIKPSGATERFYTGGFSGTVPVQLSRFQKFFLEQSAAPQTPQASLSGGELPAGFDPIVKDLAFPHRNVIAILNPAADQLRLTVNPGNGLLRGSFIHPTDGGERGLFGVLFQKSGIGGGFFPGVQTTGSFELANRPPQE